LAVATGNLFFPGLRGLVFDQDVTAKYTIKRRKRNAADSKWGRGFGRGRLKRFEHQHCADEQVAAQHDDKESRHEQDAPVFDSRLARATCKPRPTLRGSYLLATE
jgi:hypothetical protein